MLEIINILFDDKILKNEWLLEISRMQKRIVSLRENFQKVCKTNYKQITLAF